MPVHARSVATDGTAGRETASSAHRRLERAADYICMGEPAVPRDLISPVVAAERLSVGVRFVRRLIAERRLPVYHVGRHVRLSAADLDALVSVVTMPSSPPRPPAAVRRPAPVARRGKRGFGTVRRLGSGRWQARYWDPATGAQVAAPTTFESRDEAEGWLAGARTDQVRGGFVDVRAGRVLLRTWAEEWLTYRKLGPGTRDNYRWLLDKRILPSFGSFALVDITPHHVRTWHARIAQKGPSTAAKAYRLLHALLETAVEDEVLARNPCKVKGAAKEDAAERPVATVTQVEALAEAIVPRFRLLVLLAAWCCLRREELLGLWRQDLDLLHGTLRVDRALIQLRTGEQVYVPPKGGGKRTIAIPPHLLDEVALHLDAYVRPEPDASVFTGEKGGLLRPHVLQHEWAKSRKKEGLSHLRLHDLRHSGATWVAPMASLKELMLRLGHSTPDMAVRYQHATPERDREIARGLSEQHSATVLPFPAHGAADQEGGDAQNTHP